ncbi:hypothetical protein M409DRAFT_30531 [Zasmidium cellare ATCC 36951]|uniref:MARVEL domain-containing protein n=1 Tax=Zasmidium cellare ATCC 36951 TaxID=1080233 RepID=A0A6A6BZX5_ZASCE|nr:uncharacterized protein M409DRAFT_30531 [Zasmidium cellare ATCC 36951]KAF2158996.1 hypothetical protein M409DRAFT_30531 [Zasmidium cellare ATCC 36951]
MGVFDMVRTRSGHGGVAGGLARIVLRFLQFILAITVAGLYGVDLANAHKAGAYTDGKWVFAEVVAGMSAVTCLIYGACFFIPGEKFFAWDWVLFILWTALFGLFGNIYIGAKPTPEQHGQQRMKNAVWVDLVNMLLWLASAIYSTIIFWRSRNNRTLHTGRGKV